MNSLRSATAELLRSIARRIDAPSTGTLPSRQPKGTQLEPARTVIAKLGGVKAVAEILGRDPDKLTGIYRWMASKETRGTGGLVPQFEAVKLLDHARRAGLDLTAEDFFPKPVASSALTTINSAASPQATLQSLALSRAIVACGSQADLADRIGVTQQAISYWVRDLKRVPGEWVVAVEVATGIPRGELRPDMFAPAEAA